MSRRHAIRHYAMRVPLDARQHHASSRISFSLITNSLNAALRTARRKAGCVEGFRWMAAALEDGVVNVVARSYGDLDSPI
ncbi:MAG: DUF6538 domain-containing protein [Candidatus Puniceispirillaceae bacterium]